MTAAADDRLEPALRRLISVILLGGTMGIIDGTVVAVGVNTLAQHFHTSLSTVGWVSTGYLLALTVAIPVTTWAVGRFGVKRLWLFGLVLFLAASLAAGLAWNIASLITFRVVQGLGAGILDPLLLMILARAAGPTRAGRVMGLMGVVLSSGPVLGLIVGGVVLEALDWHWIFFINLPLGAAAFLGALRVLPVDEPAGQENPVRLDLVGVALLGPGFALLVLAMNQAADHAAFTVWPVLVPLAAGAALLAAYAVHALRERGTPPLIDLRLFTRPSFSAAVSVMTLIGMATFANLFILPLYYQQLHGRGALGAGLLLAPYGIGCAAAMPLAGRLSDRLGPRALARWGAVAGAVGVLVLTTIGSGTSDVWPVLGAVVFGVGLSFVGAPTMGSLYRTLPPHLVPQGSSALFILNQLGAAVGIAVITLILQTVGGGSTAGGFHGAYWFVFGAVALILGASFLLPGLPEPAPAAEPSLEEAATQAG
ncbi:DHA2 family efflux MFS transporter permease subunit [Streptomyces sp. CB01881]|uniref:DHA2 family efflux MFS transporter permease subunit n=1 Tax=Streptomyces sp. CB01881 TaxID=2078691 RepID=UPI000CDBDEF7|nr:DHA2 family efflux MFS transporter permease subunit [Streptomyces sp. CB01881]AUY52709.1 MFS transporter [Streptomyces sp. CB01881]TYC70427.1 DHA2 family efflux MFS transporter permease subunit [Streptomyces sp. CB01881]